MNQELSDLVMQVIKLASEQKITQKELAALARMNETSLSRLKTANDARFLNIQQLGNAVGLKLMWVENTSYAERIARGNLFE
ncbi:MAG: hypothetical protein QG652_117 [Pseudomonadota bacterium]|nr:hypothetical protein [Pseudomonadota bacterium]